MYVKQPEYYRMQLFGVHYTPALLYQSSMVSCESLRQLDENRIIITSLPTTGLELTHLNNSTKVLSSTAHASDQCRLDPLKFIGTLTSSI